MQTETAITERLRRSNTEFRALEESHHRLDEKLADSTTAARADAGRRSAEETAAERKTGHEG